MKKLSLVVATALCAVSLALADRTEHDAVHFGNGSTLDIRSGVPLLGTWDFSLATVLGLPGSASTFLDLTDTPNAYTGAGSKVVAVKSDESGLEFITAGTGAGTVTSFSSGDLSPLFTTSVANSTTTPALSFSLSNAAAHTFFANNTGSSDLPSFTSFVEGTNYLGPARIDDTAYNETAWNGDATHAPSKNAVRDELEIIIASGTAAVSDTAYDATTWNGVTTIAPSKNAVRDKFESLTIPTDISGAHYLTSQAESSLSAEVNLGGLSTGLLLGTVSAGVSTISSVAAPSGTIVGTTDTQTLTNKRGTPRITTITSSGTPTINTDNCDAVTITAQAAAITSMTTNLSGTPNNFDRLLIRIKDDGTARAITWGASFEAKGVALPTTTVLSKVLTVGFFYDTVTSKWGCVASAQEQ